MPLFASAYPATCPKRKRLIFIFVLVLIIVNAVSAQDVSIDIVWDTFNRNQYNGVLILPRADDGTYEFVGGFTKGSSKDGNVRVGNQDTAMISSMNRMHWEIGSLRRGMYKLILFCMAGGSDTGDQWPGDVRVSVVMGGHQQTFTPEKRKGEVWEVLYINGSTGRIEEQQTFYPFRRLIYGYTRDALTGMILPGVTVQLLDGDSGAPIPGAVKKSDEDGFYYFYNFPMGRYDVLYELDGYIPVQEKTDFIFMDLPRKINPAMSPVLGDAQFRVTLEWSPNPTDLDAHLLGPGPSAEDSFHISYSHMHEYNGRHFLDIDDKDGYGPETITIGGLDRGSYVFLVHDFKNRRPASGSWNLANSGAVVRVYRGSAVVGQFSVPDKDGTLWRVFMIDGSTGAVKPMNEMVYVREPDEVY